LRQITRKLRQHARLPALSLATLRRRHLLLRRPLQFLAVGAAVTFVWGDAIIEWYRRFVSGG